MIKDSKSLERLSAFYRKVTAIYLDCGDAAETKEDKRAVLRGKPAIDQNLDVLVEILDALDDPLRETALFHLAELLHGAFAAGKAVVITPAGQHHVQARSAGKARNSRANILASSAKERALLDAIHAIRGSDPSPKPHAEASRILSSVNDILLTSGHHEVKIDVVVRRLKTISARV